MCSTSLKASKNLDEMRDVITRICRDYLTGSWKTISSDELKLKRISGGLSNFLYHVSLPKSVINKQQKTSLNLSNVKRPRKDHLLNPPNEPNEVLLRIYGQTHGEQALETVLTDTVVFTLLSERKLGPKLHGIFPGGRIEQYIPARPLTTDELSDPNISRKVAEKMAKIHSLNIPVSKEPEWLWNTMYRWLNSAEKMFKELNTKSKEENHLAKKMRHINLRQEVDWLRSLVEGEDFAVVFCHNDLQEGNILFKEGINGDNSTHRMSSFFDDSASLDSHFEGILISSRDNKSIGDIDDHMTIIGSCPRKRLLSDQNDDCDLDNTRDSVLSGNSQGDNCDPELMIIDFEYCAYNYRGFDLANHFLEWTMDYTNTEFPFFHHRKPAYPTMEQQQRFITTYLIELASCDDYIPTKAEIDEIKEEVRCFTLASHLFWTLWSLVNVQQDIEFGYWNYAFCRLKEYFEAKDAYGKSKGLNLKRKHILDDRQ